MHGELITKQGIPTVTSRKATINSQRDLKSEMCTPVGYVTIHRFCRVSRIFAGIIMDTMVDNIWAKWNNKVPENGFFSMSFNHDETILQNPLLTILKLHQKNLCRSSDKCWGLKEDAENLVSFATNSYGVKLWAFIWFSFLCCDCEQCFHEKWIGMV